MSKFARRDALKALSAAALSAAGTALPRVSAAAENRSVIEKGAELKLLRWKRYVQGDEDLWMANTAKFTERTGVKVTVESIVGEELRAKGAMVASVGAGPDLVVGSPEMPHQYADKCVDLTEVATSLGQKYGGWYDVCQRSCILDGRWIALSIAVVSFCVVYRQSMVKTAGFGEIPRSLDGFLKLCQTLKAHGTPAGLPLGNGLGDHSWCQWLLWSHGASLVDENNRVVINSKQTVAALEYAKALYATFIPGTLSWLDPSNNKAFLAGEISLTWNPISIYYVARNSTDPAMKAMAADIKSRVSKVNQVIKRLGLTVAARRPEPDIIEEPHIVETRRPYRDPLADILGRDPFGRPPKLDPDELVKCYCGERFIGIMKASQCPVGTPCGRSSSAAVRMTT